MPFDIAQFSCFFPLCKLSSRAIYGITDSVKFSHYYSKKKSLLIEKKSLAAVDFMIVLYCKRKNRRSMMHELTIDITVNSGQHYLFYVNIKQFLLDEKRKKRLPTCVFASRKQPFEVECSEKFYRYSRPKNPKKTQEKARHTLMKKTIFQQFIKTVLLFKNCFKHSFEIYEYIS